MVSIAGSFRLFFSGLVIGLASLLSLSVAERSASAQVSEVARGATVSILRNEAALELEAVEGSLSLGARHALTGVYVAFDPSRTDVSAMVACDDDGDYVVVVSDALLMLASFVAQAEAADEMRRTHKVDEYARFLAEAFPAEGFPAETRRDAPRRVSARPVPPPPGFFDNASSRDPRVLDLERARLREIVASIVTHEVAHLLAGELVCPNPTATHEKGDDEWTAEEREHALDGASRIYTPSSVLAADALATTLLLAAERNQLGSLAWLRTMERLEPSAGDANDRTAWTYLRLHRGRHRDTTIPLQSRPTESRVSPPN
jgi:hypothetical protein